MKLLPIKNNDNETAIIDFKTNLEEKGILDSDSIDNIINFGDKVLTDLDCFKTQDRNALIVGHVQSGKTINYISIIANAYKENFDICFVLTSAITKLLKQTWKRINDSFNGFDSEESFEKYKIRMYGANNADNKDILDDLDKSNGQMLVYALMKNNLNHLEELFLKNPKLRNKKILIIDDEGDVASWSKETKGNQEEDSKTNKHLLSILNNLENRTFISITATPYVQLFVEQEELIFSKVYTLKPGNKYYGINEFIDEKNKLINVITNATESEMNISLESSYLFFLISHVYRLLDIYQNVDFNEEKYFTNINRLFSEMIIHTSEETKEHEKISCALEKTKLAINKNLETIILHYEQFGNFKDLSLFYYKFLNNQFIPVVRENFNQFINDQDFDNYIYKLIKNIYNNSKDLVIYTINSANEKKLNQFRPKRLTIYIGSKMIERGITFNNLLCSYFDNDSANLDTFLQRNRWFGYREKIAKYMKLFINQDLYDNILIKSKSTNEIFQELQRLNNMNLPLDNFDKSILPSKNKMLVTSKRFYEVDSQKILSVFYSSMVKNESANILGEIFKSYFEREYLDELTKVGPYKFKSITFNNFSELKHKILNNNDQLIANFLDNRYNKFLNRLDKFSTNKVKVFYMKTQNEEDRYRQNNDGRIQIFQGSNSEAVGEADWNKIPELQDYIIVQIYPLIIKHTNEKIVRIVFQFPDNNGE